MGLGKAENCLSLLDIHPQSQKGCARVSAPRELFHVVIHSRYVDLEWQQQSFRFLLLGALFCPVLSQADKSRGGSDKELTLFVMYKASKGSCSSAKNKSLSMS